VTFSNGMLGKDFLETNFDKSINFMCIYLVMKFLAEWGKEEKKRQPMLLTI
jgi:hypothetical protein